MALSPSTTGKLDTTLLSMPWGFVATVSNIIVGLCISYSIGKRLLIMAIASMFPLVGTILQFALSVKGPRLFGYYLSGGYNAPFVMLLALVQSSTAGTTKRMVTSGIIWVAYCAGPFDQSIRVSHFLNANQLMIKQR